MGKRRPEQGPRTMTEDALIDVRITQVRIKAGVDTPDDLDRAYRHLDDVAAVEEAEKLGDALRRPKHRALLARAIEAAGRLAV